MEEEIAVFIISHGNLAQATLQTAEKIIGPQKNVFTYTNSKDSLSSLAEQLKKKLRKIDMRQVILFVDMIGGSCWALANMIRREYPTITIITGVNLPMLLSCFTNIGELSFPKLVEKVKESGLRGIQIFAGGS
jgi:fructoselysine and glucoselysine-specific PTS system IIA component